MSDGKPWYFYISLRYSRQKMKNETCPKKQWYVIVNVGLEKKKEKILTLAKYIYII